MTEIVVTLDRSVGLAELALNRPEKKNALSAGMWSSILDHLALLETDPDVRCLVVRGEGGSFSAGADLNDARGADGRESSTYRALAEQGLQAVREFSKPTVAAIDGHCIGAGLVLALACDVRFATPASSFSLPAVRYGFAVESHGLSRVVDLVGYGQAARFLLSASSLPAAEAERVGLIEQCVVDAVDKARQLAGAIASGKPDAVAATREALRAELEH